MSILAKGKTSIDDGETLAEHTASCLEAAKALLTNLPLSVEESKRLQKDLLYSVAFHDTGKAAEGFQRLLRGERENWTSKRHEILSASLASLFSGISEYSIFAILTHHKQIPATPLSEQIKRLPPYQIPLDGQEETPIWKEMKKEWEKNALELFKEMKEVWIHIEGKEEVPTTSLGTLRLRKAWLEDGIGKGTQCNEIPFTERYYASLLRGLLITADHLGSQHKVPSPIPLFSSFSVLDANKPRSFQIKVGKTDGSCILRSPTGSGKTEAALLWAQKNQRPNGRLFYVLPYMASINSMYNRLGNIFGDNIGLLHSNASYALYSMVEKDETLESLKAGQKTARSLSRLAREMWFPIKVLTPHQILRHILRGKGWELMLAEFPNSCFVFDEIHAYEPRIVGLTLATTRLLSEWGSRCLFMSATLPFFLERLIEDALGKIPIITLDSSQPKDREIMDMKRHIIEIRGGSMEEDIDSILSKAENKGTVLIVCNHVNSAQRMFQRLMEMLPYLKNEIILFHSRFNKKDRNLKEKRISESKDIKILVATQVVEVSLDIDFDCGFFELAPIDAIVQRAGRVNRRGEKPPSSIVVYETQMNRHRLYSKELTENTINVLKNLENPLSEADLVNCANVVYGDGYRGSDKREFENGFNHPDIQNFQKNLVAGVYRDWVENVIEKADGQIEVLPKGLQKEYMRLSNEGLWIEANLLLVPIRVGMFSKFLRLCKISKQEDVFVIDCEYSPQTGLLLSNIQEESANII